MLGDLQEIQEMAEEMIKPYFSDEHLMAACRAAAKGDVSDDMKLELLCAAERIGVLRKLLRGYERFESDIERAVNNGR